MSPGDGRERHTAWPTSLFLAEPRPVTDKTAGFFDFQTATGASERVQK
jgi:hypothetical protein